MKKILAIILCLVIILGLCGCGRQKIDTLSSDGLMLKYVIHYGGIASADSDFVAGTLYTVSYEGVITNYDLYGDQTIKEKNNIEIEKTKVVELYDFLKTNEIVEIDTSLTYDNPTYIIEFYDSYGAEIFAFIGMISDEYIDELNAYLVSTTHHL